MRSRTSFPVVAIALIGVLASCEDSTSIDENFQDDATWVATLAPEGVTTSATGQAFFIDRGNTIDYMITYTGLTSNTTNAHIHRTSTSGVMVQLPFVNGATGGTVFGTIDLTRTVTTGGVASNDVAPLETGNQSAADFRTLLANGGVYVNVHSANNPGGEIRGTIEPR
jgi:hypothetical protein